MYAMAKLSTPFFLNKNGIRIIVRFTVTGKMI